MPSLCTGAAFRQSLGNREEESSHERSQETCLGVERWICGLRINLLTKDAAFPAGAQGGFRNIVGKAAAGMRLLFLPIGQLKGTIHGI